MRSTTLLVASLATVLLTPEAVRAKPLLAVSAEAGGDVVLIDPATAVVVERIKVGARPRGLDVSRDGKRLAVALAGPAKPAVGPTNTAAIDASPGLAIIDVGARKLGKQVATAPSPFAVDLAPDARTAFLSNNVTNEVVVIDVHAGVIKKKVNVGAEPQGIALRPDGKVVYVATHAVHEVSAIDVKTGNLLGRIDAGTRPQMLLLAPRGDRAFVVDEGLPTITVLDTKQNISKEQFVLQGLPKTPAPALQSAVLSPDGKSLYVTTGAGKAVLFVDPAKKAVVATVDGVGAFPRGIAISRDGKKLYTANGTSNDVAIIDVASKKVEGRVTVTGAPWDVVAVP
jgi:YVTN family beta-propeller protein